MILNDPGAKSIVGSGVGSDVYYCNEFPPGLTFMLGRKEKIYERITAWHENPAEIS